MDNVISNAIFTGIFRNPYTQKAIVASGFIKHLLKKYGVDKFKDLWLTLRDEGKVFVTVYGKPIEKLDDDFMVFPNEL